VILAVLAAWLMWNSTDQAGRWYRTTFDQTWVKLRGWQLEEELWRSRHLWIAEKTTHVLMFVPLGWLVRDARIRMPAVVGFGAVFCAIAELSQIFSRRRTATWGDFGLNVAGYAGGVALAARIRRRK